MEPLEKLFILAKINYNFAKIQIDALTKYIYQGRDVEFEDPESISFYEGLINLKILAGSLIKILKKKGVVYHPKLARQYEKEKRIVFIVLEFIYEALKNKELLYGKSYLETCDGFGDIIYYMIHSDWNYEWRKYKKKRQSLKNE